MATIQQFTQSEMDTEILQFVRGMAQTAPVTDASVHRYLTRHCERECSIGDVRDRLHYLTSAGYLARREEWIGGKVVRYEITAAGMDVLDGNVPPRGWKGQ